METELKEPNQITKPGVLSGPGRNIPRNTYPIQQVQIESPDVREDVQGVDYIEENVQSSVAKPLWALIVLTILSSTFLFSLDNTIVADVQSPIVERFGEVGKMSWLGVAFVLSGSATIIAWGKLFGIFSAKFLYLFSVVMFEVGSAICGAAPTMNAMIVGRAVAGLGGAGMYLGCLTLLSITSSVRQRPQYMALTGITWGLGTVLGPVVGGAFAQNRHATWRWSFYINLCIGAAFSPIYIFYLPRGDPQKVTSFRQKLLQIDYLGMVLNVGAFTALIMAINFGGNIFAWDSGREIALWVVGGVVLLLFILQQAFSVGTTETERVFPADFLNMPLMWLLFCLMSCAATCVFVPTYYIPLHFQFVRGDSPLGAAVGLLPFIFPMVFCGLANGAAMTKLGYYMPWYLVGGILTALGGGLMTTVNENTSTAHIYGYSALIGIGAGMYIQTGFSVAQAKVASSRASDAASFIALAQNLGITLALAISGAVFQNQALDDLQTLIPQYPRETLRGAILGPSSGLLKQLPDTVRKEALYSIVKSMSHTYYLVVFAGCLAAVGSLFMKRERIFIQAASMG
ncbi:hypothetical protein N7509_006298 [Penicillium cosmopolitanum]|uniref:Major facilitator superfamily (MFS) profile domain-containing protein n=1 Tax=Penicillium cosmopolitanum TaxID=1131564 RepID=A0A9W9W403_9EURO|nr:uncharacterized protein N7509_006298 [Penicillium cosmopolitanum]KAJ5398185.1 hypothetical protein N7509_006298 [Penicillium cosmopolitanum]